MSNKNDTDEMVEIQQHIILKKKMKKMFKMDQDQSIITLYNKIEELIKIFYVDLNNIYHELRETQTQNDHKISLKKILKIIQQDLYLFQQISVQQSSDNDISSQSFQYTFLPYQKLNQQQVDLYSSQINQGQQLFQENLFKNKNLKKIKHKKNYTEVLNLDDIVKEEISKKFLSNQELNKSLPRSSDEEKQFKILNMIFKHLNIEITPSYLDKYSVYYHFNKYLQNHHKLIAQYQASLFLKYKEKFLNLIHKQKNFSNAINQDLYFENRFYILQESLRNINQSNKIKCQSNNIIKNYFYKKIQLYNNQIKNFSDLFTTKLLNVQHKLEVLKLPSQNQFFSMCFNQKNDSQETISDSSSEQEEDLSQGKKELQENLVNQNIKLQKIITDKEVQISQYKEKLSNIFYSLQRLTSIDFKYKNVNDLDKLLSKILKIFQPYNQGMLLKNKSIDILEKRIQQQNFLKKGMKIFNKTEKKFEDNILYRFEQIYNNLDQNQKHIKTIFDGLSHQIQINNEQDIEKLKNQLNEIVKEQDHIKHICQLTCNEFLNFKSKQKKVILEILLKEKNKDLSQMIINKNPNQKKILKRIKSDYLIKNETLQCVYKNQQQANIYKIFINESFDNLSFITDLNVNPKIIINKIKQQISQFFKIFKNFSDFESFDEIPNKKMLFQSENQEQKITSLQKQIIKLENQIIFLQDKQQLADQQAILNNQLTQDLDLIKQKFQYYQNFYDKNEPKIKIYLKYLNAQKNKISQLKAHDSLQQQIIDSLNQQIKQQKKLKQSKKTMSLQKFYQHKQKQKSSKKTQKSKSKQKIQKEGKKIVLKKKQNNKQKRKINLDSQRKMNSMKLLSQIKSKKRNTAHGQFEFDKQQNQQIFLMIQFLKKYLIKEIQISQKNNLIKSQKHMNNIYTIMIVFLFLLQRIGNVLTEVQNPLSENQKNDLRNYRDNKGQKQGYYDIEYLDMIIQDENPSWLCDRVKQIQSSMNFSFEHYFNIQMNSQYELYYSRIKEYDTQKKKIVFFSKFLKIENFETGKTTKVLRELNYSFQMASNPYFIHLNKCYFEQRKATLEHVRRFPNLKIGDDIGERIYMIFDKFDLNGLEFLTTERIYHKNNNLQELDMIELIKNIAIGVRELHGQDLVHSNLSLSNIALKKRQKGRGYIPKIQNLDWVSQENELEYNSELGQNIYKAPEFISNQQRNIKSIDVYSLGIIFYALMSKQSTRQFIQSNNNFIDKKIYMQNKSMTKHQELVAIFKWMTDVDYHKRPTIVKVKLELINYRDCYKTYIQNLKKSKGIKKVCKFKYKDLWKQYMQQSTEEIDQQQKTLMDLSDMVFLKQYLIDSNMNVDRDKDIEKENQNQPEVHQSMDQIIKKKLLANFTKNGKNQFKKKWPQYAENQKKEHINIITIS